MNVTLPNGNTLSDVPDDATKDQVMDAAVRLGLAKKEDFGVTQEPVPESKTFLQGMGVTDDQGNINPLGDIVKGIADSSINLKAGGVIAEQTIKRLEPELYETNRRGDVYERWRKQIWDAEDLLSSIGNKNSPEYQQAFESVKSLKENMVLDLNGKYVDEPADQPSFTEMLNTVGDNKMYFLGQMAKQVIADPALMLTPVGYQKAAASAYKSAKTLSVGEKTAKALSVIGGAGGAGSIGYGLGATSEIVTQMDENPEAPIDLKSVNDMGLQVAAFSAVIPVAGDIAGKTIRSTGKAVKNQFNKAKAAQVQKEAQSIWSKSVDAEGNPQLSKKAAVLRAFSKVDKKKESAPKMEPIDDFMAEDAIRIAKAKAEGKPTVKEKIVEGTLMGFDSLTKGWNHITQPVISRLRDMGMIELATKLDRHDMDFMTRLQNRLNLKDDFVKQLKKLPQKERDLVHFHLNNGTIDDLLSKARGTGKFSKEFEGATQNIRGMLTSMYDEFVDAGFDINMRDNFFPREVKYAQYAKDKGLKLARTRQVLADEINRKLNLKGDDGYSGKTISDREIQSNLSNDEIAQVISKQVVQGKSGTSLTTSNVKGRVIEDISPEDLRYYADPEVALTNYIIRNTTKIQDRVFFGGKSVKSASSKLDETAVDESMYREVIKDFVNNKKSSRELFPEEVDEVIDILQSRFIGGMKSPNKGIAGLKNMLYAITLGNPISAGVQFGDLGAAGYINDVRNAAVETVSKIARSTRKLVGSKTAGKGKFTMEDFGLDAMAHEFEHLGPTAKILDWSMRKGGFKAVDRLGKEVILNSTFKKLTQKAKNPAYFQKRFGGRLSNSEITEIQKAFNVDKVDMSNPHVRLALFSELTKVQPISMSQMPQGYLNNPNARIMYMLKTFTLKQLDLARNDILNVAKKPGMKSKVEASANLMKMAMTIGLANAGVEHVKNWMRGKENLEITDAAFASLLRNWGISQYTLNDLKGGDFKSFTANMLSPPVFGVASDVFRYLTKDDYPDSKIVRHIPVAGKPISYWLEGKEDDLSLDVGYDLSIDLEE